MSNNEPGEELRRLQRRLQQTESLVVDERERHRTELAAAAEKHAELLARLEKAERRVARLQAEMKARTEELKTRQESPKELARAAARLGRTVGRRTAKAVRNPKAAARRVRSRRPQ